MILEIVGLPLLLKAVYVVSYDHAGNKFNYANKKGEKETIWIKR